MTPYSLEGTNEQAYVRGTQTVFNEAWAYPNLLPRRLKHELAWARKYDVPKVEVNDGTPDTIRRLAEVFGGQKCLFVVRLDGRAVLIPALIKAGRTYHTMASDGADVIAAGEVEVLPDGRLTNVNHHSGHYKPHKDQVDAVTQAFFVAEGLCGPKPT